MRMRAVMMVVAVLVGEGMGVTQKKDKSPVDLPGVCCYMCASATECFGCWSPGSQCSSQPGCKNCFGQWFAGQRPTIASRPPTPPALHAPPRTVYFANTTFPPLKPTTDGEFMYVNGASYVQSLPQSPYVELVNPWCEKRNVTSGELVWRNEVEDPQLRPYWGAPLLVEGEYLLMQVTYALLGPSLTVYFTNGTLAYNFSLDVAESASRVTVGESKFFYMEYPTTTPVLVSRELSDHSLNWQKFLGPEIVGDLTAPVTVDDLVFKTGKDSGNYYIYALNTTTGDKEWLYECPESPWMARVIAHKGITYLSMATFSEGVPFGDALGTISAIEGGTQRWGRNIAVNGVIKEPAVRTAPNGVDHHLYFTTCYTPIVDGAPPMWWINCDIMAVNTRAIQDSDFPVMWRFAGPEDAVLSEAKLFDDVLYVSGVYFINGTWPNCTWPYSEQFPNCTWPVGNSTLDDLPFRYTEPFLMAVSATNGSLLWNMSVDIGNLTVPFGSWEDILAALAKKLFPGPYPPFPPEDFERPEWMPGDGTEYDVTGMLSALEEERVLLPLPWLVIPWEEFDIDTYGQTLLYASQEGLIALDISSEDDSGEGEMNWMLPIAGATMGITCIIIFVVAIKRHFHDKKARGEEMRKNSEKEALLRKRRSVDVYHSIDGGITQGSGSTGVETHRTTAEEEHGYEIIRQLGKGGFGNVYLVRRKADDELVSLKKIICRCERELRIARREVSILTNLPKHPGLVRILDSFAKEGAVYFVMPFYEQGDLATYIAQFPAPVIPEDLVVSFAQQIGEILYHLHTQSPPVVHRDLKPENILVTQDRQRVVLADFGLSRMVDKTYMHTHAGTMAFMAPEAFDGPYDTKVDIWSLGCIIYAMCMRRARNCRVMCVHVGRRDFYPEITRGIAARGYSDLVVDLVRQTLQTNRHARPAAEEVVFRLGEDSPCALRVRNESIGSDQRDKGVPKGARLPSTSPPASASASASVPAHAGSAGSPKRAPHFIPPGILRGAAAAISDNGAESSEYESQLELPFPSGTEPYIPSDPHSEDTLPGIVMDMNSGQPMFGAMRPPGIMAPGMQGPPGAGKHVGFAEVDEPKTAAQAIPTYPRANGHACSSDSIQSPDDDSGSDAWSPPSPPPPNVGAIQSGS